MCVPVAYLLDSWRDSLIRRKHINGYLEDAYEFAVLLWSPFFDSLKGYPTLDFFK